jgi:hypothetical protein
MCATPRHALIAATCGAVLAAVAPTGISAVASPAVPATTVACDQSSVQAAISHGGVVRFGADCNLQLTSALNVPRNESVTIDGAGHAVTLNGDVDEASPSRVIEVSHATLVVESLTIANGIAFGHPGSSGQQGADGISGTADGEDGKAGKPGAAATAGQSARGGGMLISRGSVVVAVGVTFSHNRVIGGTGGNGGSGGHGGGGAPGAPGGNSGHGGAGGTAKPGANGGTARGGAVFNAGSLAVVGGRFTANTAIGGSGGDGGNGGFGGTGGSVGCKHPCGGSAGAGGAGATGGSGGNGAQAAGAGIFSTGTLSLRQVAFDTETATGGEAGSGGFGGNGGAGGCVPSCAADGDGGDGGDGGIGGDATGGAIVSSGRADSRSTSFDGDAVTAGTVGASCYSPGRGCGGPAGSAGGPGGTPGKQGASGTNGAATHRDSDNSGTGLSPLRITTSSLPDGHRHRRYHARLRATGGIAPYAFGCRHLPRGLRCSAAGRISGRPRHAGRVTVRVDVADPFAATPTTDVKHLTLAVHPH